MREKSYDLSSYGLKSSLDSSYDQMSSFSYGWVMERGYYYRQGKGYDFSSYGLGSDSDSSYDQMNFFFYGWVRKRGYDYDPLSYKLKEERPFA